MELAQARARRPGPKFCLAVNKLWARKRPGLILKSSVELFSGLEPRVEDNNWSKTNEIELRLPKMICYINNFAELAFLGVLGKIFLA